MSESTVSIVVPAYNSEKYIKDTLLSILDQSFQDIEIIVVDDASTDDTAKVVNAFNSNKIIYIRLPENHGGPSKPRNVGINNANGKYIAFFDSDDLMLPRSIESAVSMLELFPSVGMIFTDAQKFDNKTGDDYEERFLKYYDHFNSIKTNIFDSSFYIIDKKQAFNCLFYENFILTCGVTVRREIFEKVGFFDESLTNADDWDMWFRVSQFYNLGYLDRVSFKYRIRGNSISDRGAKNSNNKIRVLHKRLESDLDGDVRDQAHKLIAQNYADMGYSYRCNNQMSLARKNYVLSLKERLDWHVVSQWLITFLGYDTINFLRNIKKMIIKHELP